MNNEDYALSSYEIDDDDNNLMNYDPMRATLIVQKKKEIFNDYYKSKWANLKLFLQEQKSLESSVKLQKQKTIEQFSSKCQEIYKKKIEIQLITKKNRQTFKSYNSNLGGEFCHSDTSRGGSEFPRHRRAAANAVMGLDDKGKLRLHHPRQRLPRHPPWHRHHAARARFHADGQRFT